MNKKLQYFSYIFFAIILTLINIGTQSLIEFIVLSTRNSFFQKIVFENITAGLFMKMIIATIIAFTFKFVVDKIFIFNDKSKKIEENIRQIFFYGLFAVFTTLIFWSMELLFKFFLVLNYSEYIGAIIGLTIGVALLLIQ